MEIKEKATAKIVRVKCGIRATFNDMFYYVLVSCNKCKTWSAYYITAPNLKLPIMSKGNNLYYLGKCTCGNDLCVFHLPSILRLAK